MDTLNPEIARLFAAKVAPPQVSGATFPGQGQSRAAAPGDGRASLARARKKSARVESRRPRRVAHAGA